MEISKLIRIEVAYAKPEVQVILALELEAGATIEEAIQRSGLLERFPEIDLAQQAVGVFSQPRQLNEVVKEGDRIEIYRPLKQDPKEARREKARKR
jgi:putative ubiquitin-RnfH superfamily antitoxin RatB of RatAB toxin-antitoxin module